MKKTLIYIPVIYRFERGVWPPTLPTCWYYRWQKKLYDNLSTKDIKVIWKAGPRTSNLYDPIKLMNAPNIRYSTKSLNSELKKTDMVLLDCLSTPFMDSIRKDLPVLCLVYKFDKFYLRKDVFDMFDKNIFIVSNFEQGLVLVDDFIEHTSMYKEDYKDLYNINNWVKDLL